MVVGTASIDTIDLEQERTRVDIHDFSLGEDVLYIPDKFLATNENTYKLEQTKGANNNITLELVVVMDGNREKTIAKLFLNEDSWRKNGLKSTDVEDYAMSMLGVKSNENNQDNNQDDNTPKTSLIALGQKGLLVHSTKDLFNDECWNNVIL